MVPVLNGIMGAVVGIGQAVLWALETCLNLTLAAIVALIAVVLAALPSLPAAPNLSGGFVGWLNWFMPVAQLAGIFAVWAGLWVTFLGVRIAMKWVKAL